MPQGARQLGGEARGQACGGVEEALERGPPAAAQPVHLVRPAVGAGEVVGPASLRVLALPPSVAVAEAFLDLEVVCQAALAPERDVATLEGATRRRGARGELGVQGQRKERLRGIDDARTIHAVPHHAKHAQAAGGVLEHC